MSHNTAPPCANLAFLSRKEKLKIWLDRNGFSIAQLANNLGVAPSHLSRTLRQDSMPSERHAVLRAFIPAELLPEPMDKRPGAKPKAKNLLTPDYLEILKHRPVLRPKEVEGLYGIKARTLDNLRSQGGGPAYLQGGGKGKCVLYTHEAIRNYLGMN